MEESSLKKIGPITLAYKVQDEQLQKSSILKFGNNRDLHFSNEWSKSVKELTLSGSTLKTCI